MKVTIDTNKETITILSSFHYNDFVAFREKLPVDWKGFMTLVPIEYIDQFIRPDQIEQKPYPLTKQEDFQSENSCSCSCSPPRNEYC